MNFVHMFYTLKKKESRLVDLYSFFARVKKPSFFDKYLTNVFYLKMLVKFRILLFS